MKHYYPSYYEEFHCIAAACPDSCCQGWDVVIDSETEAYYSTVDGELGEKLREALYIDADGDRVFRLAAQKKCPFWRDDKLCELYRALGEEHLCATCAQFPRIRMEYADFTEHTLALACPEAARLILSADSNAYRTFDRTEAAGCEAYSEGLMRFLLQTRQEAARILTQDKPLSGRLNELLTYAMQAQIALTGAYAAQEVDPAALFGTLEYIDEQNRQRFIRAAKPVPDIVRHEKELTNLALYWLYRYCLSAVDTLDILSPIRFLILSLGVVAHLSADSEIIPAAQLYSKEIEQSYENMEQFLVVSG